MTVDFSYCGHNETVLPAWEDGGFRPCFLATTQSMTLFIFAFVFCGIVTVWPLRSSFSEAKILRRTHMFMLLAWSLCAIAAAITHIIMVTVHHHAAVQYVVVTDTLTVFAWFLAFQPVRRAVKGKQPLHLVSVIFATGALIFCAMEAASYRSSTFFLHNVDNAYNTGLLIVYCVRAAGILAYAATCWLLWAKQHCACMLPRPEREGYVAINAADVTSEGTVASPVGSAASAKDGAAAAGEAAGTDGQAPSASQQNSPQGTVEERSGTTFSDLNMRVRVIWPFLWPKGKRMLQFRVLVCIALLTLGRVVNLYVPISYKLIVDKLTPKSKSTSSFTAWNLGGSGSGGDGITFPLSEILVYVGLRFLSGGGSGGMGLLNNFRSFLWISVQQYTTRISRVETFEHLHSLSLRWHLSRKTGEVLRMVDRGTSSISSLLSYVLFNILPTLVDIAIACVYFTSSFGPYFGLTVFVTMLLYIYVTINVTEWRTKFRRGMNTRDNHLRQMAVDSLLNFETVKYYNGEEFERNRYDKKMGDYLQWFWSSQASLNLLNVLQSVVITSGLLIGTLLCGYMVAEGQLTVGDFVLFISYVVQLYAPLNFFGTYYRMIQSALIDMENMFDLLQVDPEVKDAPDARELNVSTGSQGCSIEFRDVSFAYEPRKATLKNISFRVEPGQSIALVGSSGSGKSTIMRLLFRFYDVNAGQIFVDGQDVSHVTQRSLRSIMGVVPQDTVLFNDTIKYNIRYARPDCSEEEIIEAAKAAEIHEAILSFPDGYETIVGERGLKLSGGEKQRVAISRAVLKAPQVILLDEATSALDTQTERSIQRSLNRVCEGRTSITIAHRLSTIVGADQILVVDAGEIIERGTHADLLERGGAYAEMWRRQLEADEDIEEEAREAIQEHDTSVKKDK